MSDLQITELKTRRTVLQGLLAETDDAIERATKRQRREDDRGFKPTRPMGMYFNFQGAKIKELLAEQPSATIPQLMKQACQCWRKMSRLERAPWAKAAEEERIAYARDIAVYNGV